jgi:hypothetical protein
MSDIVDGYGGHNYYNSGRVILIKQHDKIANSEQSIEFFCCADPSVLLIIYPYY